MNRHAFIFGIIAIGLLGFVSGAHASVLYPYVNNTDVSLNGTVSVELRLDSENEVINAVESVLAYDPAVLQVVDISRGSSFITLWTDAPVMTEPGRIRLSGGRPDGDLVSGGNVVTVTFRTVKTGTTTIAVQPGLSGVYLSDGHGTPTKLTAGSLTLYVTESLTLLTQPTSPSHPTESSWSPDRTFILNWTPYKDVVVSYALGRNPNAVPDDIVETNTGLATFPNLQDGIWYLGFAERFPASQWSTPVHREVRIDGTPPAPFEVSLVKADDSGQSIVSFAAVDATSGVARYVATIVRWPRWMPWESRAEQRTVAGPFALEDESHVAHVTISAYDNAGNVRAETLSVAGFVSVRSLVIGLFGAIILLCCILLGLLHQRIRRRS